MRIGIDAAVLVAPYLRSGIYIYIRHMLEGLYRSGIREAVTLFLPNFPKPVDPRLRAELQSSFRGWPVKVWHLPRWAYNLRVRLSAYSRMEVFHFPSMTSFPENIPDRANVFTLPDLTFLHYPQHHTSGNVSNWSRFCERAVKHGDMILTYSEHTRQDIVRTLGVPEHKIRVTPLAAGSEFRPIADRALLRRQLASFGLQDQRYILSVGTLEPRKNQARLIRAFARLLRLEPGLPHQLVFAGGKGWDNEPIFEAVKQEGIEDRILFLGRSDPLEVLYNGADLMVYPSLYEGFGLPPLEALACGTPVITSNSSSLPEVVGDAALSVDPEDEEGLCEAMRHVLQDEKLRVELSAKGVQRARQFSWERTAATTLEAYQAAHRMKV
jgi:glycosyltransferase involved in cell wall biosynthesis